MMTEQHPITTAPKDGTQILCLCSDGKKRYCWWVGCNSVEGFWQAWTEAEPVSWFKDTQLPPSLKKQALTDLAEIPIDPENGVLVSALDNIRRALEFLPD